MADKKTRFLPIIYVRGYAMTEGEINDTTADPFCGFNLGATMYRAVPDDESGPEKRKSPIKFVFESPVLRLMSDFNYNDVFRDGLDLTDDLKTGEGPDDEKKGIPLRSIIVYHYYEKASTTLGAGEKPDIRQFALGLNSLILRVRDLVCSYEDNNMKPAGFGCYLVAHSMGGLVCRAFLQNPALGTDEARKCVEKVFTYATPHNGIEMAGINVPRWVNLFGIDTFNREVMAEYLDMKKIYKDKGTVYWLPEKTFPSEKFFCMIGTDRADYKVAEGLARTFAGNGSDGLVKIANASVWGIDSHGEVSTPCPTAYAYRSHSGYFGIVNSEDSYQNLTRFLFGDARADMWIDIEHINLPAELQDEAARGKKVDALYYIEVTASPRGKYWYLTRRIAEEDSAACLSHAAWEQSSGSKSLYLSTIFLADRARINRDDRSLSYQLKLSVRLPDYIVEGNRFWQHEHYEGGTLYHDYITISLTPPEKEDSAWTISYSLQSNKDDVVTKPLTAKELSGNKKPELLIDFGNDHKPGIKGKLRFVISKWNYDLRDEPIH